VAEDTTAGKQTETVKIESPKGSRRPHVSVIVADELGESAHNFADFVREYAVVGLAVGFIVGQQANAVVKQLVDSFVDPWVKVLFGQDLSGRYFTLHHGTEPVQFPWGKFVYNLTEFFFVLILIYVIIKVFHLNRLKKKSKRSSKISSNKISTSKQVNNEGGSQ